MGCTTSVPAAAAGPSARVGPYLAERQNARVGAGGQRAGVGDAATNCVLPLGEHSTSHRTSHRTSSATAGSSFMGGGPSYGEEVLCFNGATAAQVTAARDSLTSGWCDMGAPMLPLAVENGPLPTRGDVELLPAIASE
jgi:hypothetical protein